MKDYEILITTSITNEALYDTCYHWTYIKNPSVLEIDEALYNTCSHWTGYYCMVNEYQYKKLVVAII